MKTVAGRFVPWMGFHDGEASMSQDRIAEIHDVSLADEALDRSGEETPPSKYCVGPRPNPKPSWIDRA
jgi:hypothetical protein